MSHWKSIALLSLTCLQLATGCQKQVQTDEEERSIKESAKAYEKAFNEKNAEGLAALWTEDAEYVDPETGDTILGREAIEEEFRSTFQENTDSQIKIHIGTITFSNDSQAVQTGTVIIQDNSQKTETAYKALYVKEKGKWLIAEVREVEISEPPSQFEHLKQLEWMIGEWVDKDEDVTIETDNTWDKYKNFITQHFTVNLEEHFLLEGKQIIGWDPVQEVIRSWIFDSDGTFGEGTWTKKDNSWVVESVQTLADGRRASSINIYTPIDNNSYEWESINREIDGEILPNIDPIKVVRKGG
ncbi:MAG: hypothetical protein Tsb0021_18210 [Chlamydiales bacterium]